jgi:hypothetical protein
VTELSDALASRRGYGHDPFVGLSPVELAAAEVDLHLSTCDEPYLEDCALCQVRLARLRTLIGVVRPVIEEDAYRRGYGVGREDEAAGVPVPGRHAAPEEETA